MRHHRMAAVLGALALGATGIAGFQTFVYLAVSRTTAVNALLMLAAVEFSYLAATLLGDRKSRTLAYWKV